MRCLRAEQRQRRISDGLQQGRRRPRLDELHVYELAGLIELNLLLNGLETLGRSS
jgi:hypothetical protein